MVSIYKATMTSLRKFSFVIDQRHIRKKWDKQIQIKSSFLIKFLIVVDDDD